MRLRHVEDSGRNQVQCFKCRTWHFLCHSVADLDDAAFEAYYCEVCVRELPTFGMSPAQEAEWNLQRAGMAHEASDGSKSE